MMILRIATVDTTVRNLIAMGIHPNNLCIVQLHTTMMTGLQDLIQTGIQQVPHPLQQLIHKLTASIRQTILHTASRNILLRNLLGIPKITKLMEKRIDLPRTRLGSSHLADTLRYVISALWTLLQQEQTLDSKERIKFQFRNM